MTIGLVNGMAVGGSGSDIDSGIVVNDGNEGEDPCNLKPGPRPGERHCLALMPVYYIDTETKTCYKGNYGGCGGNANLFRNKLDCKKAAAKCVKNDSESDIGSDIGSDIRSDIGSDTGSDSVSDE